MGDRPTLILTTRLGVRPLGVRGDPLHAVAGQLLAVIRRRLGEGPANLLAEPQLRESGDGIDWYAAHDGTVRRFADLAEGLAWFRQAIRSRPEGEDLARSVFESLRSAPTDPRLMVEIARLRRELLRPERIERVFRDRQAAMATELRALLLERDVPALTAAVRAEALAGAVFAAVTVWSDAPSPGLRDLGPLTEEALAQIRPLLRRTVT